MRRILLIAVVGLSAAAGGRATPHPELGKPWIDTLTVADYPSGSHQNWDLRLDASGLVWAGNSGGVQYFDGSRWRLIRTPHSTIVYSPRPAEDGRVYLGTTSDVGYLEAGPDADWRYVSLLEGRTGVPQFGNVYKVEETAAGIFFWSRRLLFRFLPDTGELRWVEARGRFRFIAPAGDRIYAADDGAGILRYDAGDDRLVPVVDWAALGDAEFASMAVDAGGRLLVVTSSGLYTPEGGELVAVPTEVDGWLRASRPYQAVSLADGTLSIGSRLDGLVVLSPDGSLLRRVSRANGLAWNWVTHQLLDRRGGLWASQEGGISRIEIDPVLTYFDEPLGVDGVQALARHRGRLIAATGDGLKVLEPAGRADGQARFADLAADGVQTWSLLDTGDELLVGDRGGVEVLRLSPEGEASAERVYEGRRAVHLSVSNGHPDVVFAALEDGVARLRRDGGRWRGDGKLTGVEVPVIFVEQDDDGALWFGTITGIYYRVRSVAGWPDAEVETFRAEAGVPSGDSHLFRAAGRVLFGTFDGFLRFDGGHFASDPEFPEPLTDGSLNIHRLAEGPDGRLWIHGGWIHDRSVTGVATPRAGGWDWDPRPLRSLAKENLSALHVDPDGVVWLGRRSGVVRFDPALWREPAPLPAARVHRVSVPGEPSPLYGGAVPAASFPTPALDPSRRALRFEFALADFAPPHGVEYRTRLDGVDGDWTEWTTEARRDFTNLPPGRRTFRVEARNRLGQVSPQGAFRLRLLPPWHRTWPAYLGYAIAAAALVAGAAAWSTRRRTARLETERQRLEAVVEERTEEIRLKAAELVAAHEAKNRFFANVSHELRTPLTLTLGPLEDAASGRFGALPAGAAESVETALGNARQLRNLVDQVLDVGRLEAGRMPLAAAPGDLGDQVRRVAARFAVAAGRGGVEFDIDGIEDGVEAWFDAGHVDRMVSNLLSNALKFTPEGGRVSVRVARRDEAAVIEVRDTGVGIAEADLPRIFERYFQAERTASHQPGTGIGLALVRELTALHGGGVSAESEPGNGATFRVTLPLGRAHLTDDRIAPAAPPDPPPAPPEASPAVREPFPENADEPPPSGDATTLLIVDDNAELRGFLRRRFAADYRVIEAADGTEALDACRRSTPDLVVADVMMPRMDGLELTRRLKSDPDLSFVPVILLTARADTEDAVEGLGVGADDYLRKPFDAVELSARVERLIASRRQLRARFAAPEAAPGLSGPDAEFDRRLLAAMEELLEKGELSVRTLSDALAMDRSHLYRRAQAVRGVSPQELIRKVRLQAAARMLRSGHGTVTEVAYSVGFKSLGHFSDSFRRHFGLAPSRWQRAVDASPGLPDRRR